MFIAPLGICDDPPTATEIIQLAIQLVLFDPDNPDYAPAVAGLVKAYLELDEIERDGGGEDPKLLKERAAEDCYRVAYRVIRPNADEHEAGYWPDALPYGTPLPKFFIRDLAHAIARKELATQEAVYRHFRELDKVPLDKL